MTTRKKKLVEVAQVEGAEVPAKILAQAIVDISRGMNALLDGPLNRTALVVLIQAHAGGRTVLAKETIELVLSCIGTLEDAYVRKPRAKR